MSDAEVYDTIMYIAPTNLDSGVIWVGTDDGLLQLTRDSGAHWQNVTPKAMPHWARIMGMEAGHYSAGTVYVAAEGHMAGDDQPHLFVSDDFAATSRSISGDLPRNLFIRSIREDPKNPKLLYAGTQRGVWVSFDRGVHWHDMRLNMPATAIYDLEIQPDQNDLIVGTHGRGVWILDDLTPLQQLPSAQGRPAALFAPRPAYRVFAVSPVNTNNYDPNAPISESDFIGKNAPSGAIINYYLRSSTRTKPTINLVDTSGRVVRHLKGKAMPNHIGVNRAMWNLTEDGPVPWNKSIGKATEPHDGAEVLPGTYTVVLHAGGRVERTLLVVKQDPRDPSTVEQYRDRHDILAQLYGEFSSVNSMLNTIDAKRPVSAALVALKARLTNAPKFHVDLGHTPQLRERLLDMLSQFSTSFQAPTASQKAEAATLKGLYESLSAGYQKLR